MLPRKPRTKEIHPVYRVTDTLVRIGAEPGVTADVDDTGGVMLSFIDRIDGTRTFAELVASVQSDVSGATEADIRAGLERLIELGFVEDAAHDRARAAGGEVAQRSAHDASGLPACGAPHVGTAGRADGAGDGG